MKLRPASQSQKILYSRELFNLKVHKHTTLHLRTKLINTLKSPANFKNSLYDNLQKSI